MTTLDETLFNRLERTKEESSADPVEGADKDAMIDAVTVARLIVAVFVVTILAAFIAG